MRHLPPIHLRLSHRLSVLGFSAAAFGFAALAAPPSFGADRSAPSAVVLPAFAANLSQLNIKLVVRYARKPTGSVVDTVYIRSVKAGSIAEKAGLKQGMELVAIQSQPVTGLNSFQFDALCDQAVEDALILAIKRSAKAEPEEIQIKLPRS